MERGVFYILASSPEGRDLAWSSIEGERATWARERESLKLANESLARSLERQDLALAHMREAWDRERELLIEREASAVANLQKQVDFSDGLISVRSVLENIVTTAFPNRSATDALRCYCDDPKFQEYLAIVGADKGFPTANLTKSAKAVYGMLSQTIHGGSAHAPDATAVPQSVLRDKCTLLAMAAIFRFERRDVRFYVGGPSAVLKLPSPPRSASHSPAGSATSSPPKGADAVVAFAAGNNSGNDGEGDARWRR